MSKWVLELALVFEEWLLSLKNSLKIEEQEEHSR